MNSDAARGRTGVNLTMMRAAVPLAIILLACAPREETLELLVGGGPASQAEFYRLQTEREESQRLLPVLLTSKDEREVMLGLLLARGLREDAEPATPALESTVESGPPNLRAFAGRVLEYCRYCTRLAALAGGDPSPQSDAHRADKRSESGAILRFYDQHHRIPGEEDDLSEFEAGLVMARLDQVLASEVKRIRAFEDKHGRAPRSLSELGADLTGDCLEVDLGYLPLYASGNPERIYWPPAEGRGWVFGVRSRCHAWFGLAPNMWGLDYLISPADFDVHPEWEGFKRVHTKGSWSTWYSSM